MLSSSLFIRLKPLFPCLSVSIISCCPLCPNYISLFILPPFLVHFLLSQLIFCSCFLFLPSPFSSCIAFSFSSSSRVSFPVSLSLRISGFLLRFYFRSSHSRLIPELGPLLLQVVACLCGLVILFCVRFSSVFTFFRVFYLLLCVLLSTYILLRFL